MSDTTTAILIISMFAMFGGMTGGALMWHFVNDAQTPKFECRIIDDPGE